MWGDVSERERCAVPKDASVKKGARVWMKMDGCSCGCFALLCYVRSVAFEAFKEKMKTMMENGGDRKQWRGIAAAFIMPSMVSRER